MPFTKGDKNINRKGRGPGAVSIVDALKRKLQEYHPQERRKYLDLFVDKIIEKSLAYGDVPMMRDVINRIDGMPVQKTELGGLDGQPLIVRIDSEIAKKYDTNASTKNNSKGQA